MEMINGKTIADTKLTPWIGFVYTFPNYRGNRYIGKLISYAEEVAKLQGFTNVYINGSNRNI